jgi:membrane protein
MFTEPDIILRHDANLSCEEIVPSTGKSHSTVRHGVAGRGLQYVPGFFSSLLVVLGLMSNLLRGRNGGELAGRLSRILPSGSWQLVSDSLLRREVNPWAWVLFGWVGTLLVGSQVMKLIMEGIHLIYGDRERHSFLARQLRGLLLFCVSIVAWLLAIGLSVFGQPLRQWINREFGPSPLILGFWTVMLPVLGGILTMLVLP